MSIGGVSRTFSMVSKGLRRYMSPRGLSEAFKEDSDEFYRDFSRR